MEACWCASSPSSSTSILTTRPKNLLSLPVSAAIFKANAAHNNGRTRRGGVVLLHRSYYSNPLSYALTLTLTPKRRRKLSISAVFERFTERAIKAVVFSQREAGGLGKDMVYTQHLLLGLVAEDRSKDGFLGSGITVDRAREAVKTIWSEGGGSGDAAAGVRPAAAALGGLATDLPFSVSSKRVFEAAVEFSRNMGCNFIAPEHIAVGLFTADDGSAGQVLKSMPLTGRSLCRPPQVENEDRPINVGPTSGKQVENENRPYQRRAARTAGRGHWPGNLSMFKCIISCF